MFITPPPLSLYLLSECVFFFKYIYVYITPKSYYLIMFNNKVFNVSLITTFNDLHTFINFIIKKFDRFHDKFTPYTSLPIINGVWFSLPQNCRVNILFYQLQTEMLGYLLPFTFLWNDMLKMVWNNINFQTSTASHSSTNYVIFQKHVR